jgi:integrase
MNLPAAPNEQRVALAGQAANSVAARLAFGGYRSRRADHTLRRQDADLQLFREYLAEVKLAVGDLATDPEAWRGLTWGIVAGFVQWQVNRGYAIGSINVRLTTVKVYAGLAAQSGVIPPEEKSMIKDVKGFSLKEGKRIDARRETKRVGHKKAKAVAITKEQAFELKTQPGFTAQGRRDALLMCLLLDHGLRCGEVAGLEVDCIDLDSGMMTFYRPKVDKVQVHLLTEATLQASIQYLATDAPEEGPLLRASYKGGELSHAGMSEQAITARVRELGERVGVKGLSAHDCRHFWATAAAQAGTDPFRLQEAGGWSSLAMPRRYVEAAKISNIGIKL